MTFSEVLEKNKRCPNCNKEMYYKREICAHCEEARHPIWRCPRYLAQRIPKKKPWAKPGVSYEDLGYIYFITSTDIPDYPIKIGYSKDMGKSRLMGLQTGNPNELLLIGFHRGTHSDEQRLHGEFTHIRGEWFSRSKALIDYMRANLRREALAFLGLEYYPSRKK